MSDEDIPYRERVRLQLEDRRTAGLLYVNALRKTGSPADAEDLVADAVEEVLRPGGTPWVKGSFLKHTTYVMRRVWDNHQSLFSVQKEIADEEVTRGTKGFGREPPADDELHRHRWIAVLGGCLDTLLAAVAPKHPLVKDCIQLGLQGVEQPAEQAVALQCDVEEVYEAHRVIKRHAPRIRKEWERAEEERMRELRQKFGPKRREVPS